MLKNLFTILGLVMCISVSAQVGIGNTAPNGALDISSTNNGLLIPRIALVATNVATVVTPTVSELVYNTATSGIGALQVTPGYYYWNGTMWVRLATGAAATGVNWSVLGNGTTTPALNFIGTTDNVDFVTRTNNTERMRVLAGGRVSVNNAVPFTTGNLVSHSTTANHAIAVQSTSTGAGVYSEKTGAGFGMYNLGMNAAAGGIFSNLANNVGSDDGVIGHANNSAGFGGGWFLNLNGSNGTGFGSAEQGYGVLGMNSVVSDYSVGVMGTVQGGGNNVGRRSSGVFGSNSTGSIANSSGALGYRTGANGAGTFYGGYFFGGTHIDGAVGGRSSSFEASSVGSGSIGGLMGGWAKGSVYGFTTRGERYSLYVQGREFTNDIITQLNDNGTKNRTATYVPTSTTVDITSKGIASLNSGNAVVTFGEVFKEMISSKEPVIITVTPIGESNGIHLVKTSDSGFVVKENGNGNSNVKFTWIAVATKKGYENVANPKELLANDYDKKLNDFMIDENDKDAKGQTMWWDGNEIKYSGAPKSNNRLKLIEKKIK